MFDLISPNRTERRKEKKCYQTDENRMGKINSANYCHRSIFDWVWKMVSVNSSAVTRYIVFIQFHTFSMWIAYNFDVPLVRSLTKRHQINVLACINIFHWNRFNEFRIVVEALQSTTVPTICSIGWNRKRISTNK